MTTREMIEVMEAYERGEKIEFIRVGDGAKWHLLLDPSWEWSVYDYRIRPKEPKMITVYEYMCFSKLTNDWFIVGELYKNDEDFKEVHSNKNFKRTGREFQVEEY